MHGGDPPATPHGTSQVTGEHAVKSISYPPLLSIVSAHMGHPLLGPASQVMVDQECGFFAHLHGLFLNFSSVSATRGPQGTHLVDTSLLWPLKGAADGTAVRWSTRLQAAGVP